MRQHRPLSRGHELFEGIHQPRRGAVADGVGFDAEAMAFQMTHGLGMGGSSLWELKKTARWWLSYPSKYDIVSWDDDIPN